MYPLKIPSLGGVARSAGVGCFPCPNPLKSALSSLSKWGGVFRFNDD